MQEALTAWTLAHRPRHVVYRIVGDQWAARSHQLRDFLSRNGVPFEFAAADSDRGRQLLRDFGIDAARLPAAIHSSGRVLYDPALADLAASHGIATRPSQPVYDLAVLGAGPAGLAAGVYGASEGLRTLVIEPEAIGGQAGTSSMIRNYLGFTRGVAGAELAHRAWEQAVLFGAEFMFTQPASGLTARGPDRVITFLDGTEVVARAVLLAVGVTYRRLPIPALDRLVGSGVFYGAAGVEAPALAGEQVYVVGGANSAGQAALHLAKFAARVTLLIRGDSLTAGMSAYLVTQIEAAPTIDVRLHTRLVDGRGESRLRRAHPRGHPDRTPQGGPRGRRLHPHRRRTTHRLAAGRRPPGRPRVRPHRNRRSGRRMAGHPRPATLRKQPAGCLRRRRRPPWLRQASRGRRRRGIRCRRLRPPLPRRTGRLHPNRTLISAAAHKAQSRRTVPPLVSQGVFDGVGYGWRRRALVPFLLDQHGSPPRNLMYNCGSWSGGRPTPGTATAKITIYGWSNGTALQLLRAKVSTSPA